MKNLCDPAIERFRIPHPAGDIPDHLRPWAGAFIIPRPSTSLLPPVRLRAIVSRGGYAGWDADDPDHERWDHVSVSLPDRCPTWEEMCFIKELFFKPDEDAMQLHPPRKEWISNHPYCLHLWRPIDTAIPKPPSILVGYQELNT